MSLFMMIEIKDLENNQRVLEKLTVCDRVYEVCKDLSTAEMRT